MKQLMKKLTLTFLIFLGGFSMATAQSVNSNENTKKEVNPNSNIVVKKKKNAVKVKSTAVRKMEAAPVKTEEAVIEEKKTKQK